MPPSSHILRQRRVLLVSAMLLGRVLLSVSVAQVPTAIRPDGTLGTTVTQSGNIYAIIGGTRPGNGPNLFHSFDRFSVGKGDTATFTSEQTGIKHILSRVTGGQRSDIDGQLRTDGQLRAEGANLYLLNPNGVLFGPNASLDISGSFHVSTADYLRLADGARFYARLSETSTLSVAPPVAFGFLGPTPAPITVQGSTLTVAETNAFSVVGGDIQIVGGQLVAPSGRVQLASVASPGEVRFSPPELAPELHVDSVARLGRITLAQGALVNASGNGGGTVLLRSGGLLVDGANIFADNTGPVDGPNLGVDVGITEDVVLTNGGLITTDSFGAGRARDLRLTAGSVSLDHSIIGSRPFASGAGGNVLVQAGTVTLQGGSISTATDAHSGGNAGNLAVEAGRLTLTGGGLISSSTLGEGDAGRLVISAPTLSLDGGRIVASTSSKGQGGDITLNVGQLTLTGGAQISTSTGGSGRGGTVTVMATEMISIAGRDQAGNASGLFSNAYASGDAGNLAVEAGRLTLSEGGQISASTWGSGRGGNVTVAATEQLDLSNGGTISARSTGQGDAGYIGIQAGELFRSRHGAVTTEAERADGGKIQFTIGSRVELHDSQVTATVTGGEGNAGSITIDSQFVIMQRSQVRADAFGGSGGNVRLAAEVFLADPASQVSASSARNIARIFTNLNEFVAPPLAPDFARATALLQDRCAARLWEGTVSTFVVRGRPSPPTSYDSPLPSRLYTPQHRQPTTPAGADFPSVEPPAPPQGLLLEEPAGRVQRTAALALPSFPLGLALPCVQ